jgi:hypothetical protein
LPSSTLCQSRTAGGIAAQQHPFLTPQGALRRRRPKRGLPPRRGRARIASVGRHQSVFAEARRNQHDGEAEQRKTYGENAEKRDAAAKRRARRPPDDAAESGRVRQHGLRL